VHFPPEVVADTLHCYLQARFTQQYAVRSKAAYMAVHAVHAVYAVYAVYMEGTKC
jgi:hypothetical protein